MVENFEGTNFRECQKKISRVLTFVVNTKTVKSAKVSTRESFYLKLLQLLR